MYGVVDWGGLCVYVCINGDGLTVQLDLVIRKRLSYKTVYALAG